MSAVEPAVSRRLLGAIALCFFLSGFAALLYQTVWQREFSLVFGTSELAVATVLAVYMGGLALGAALAERWVGRLAQPVLAYGLLEAGIAAAALLVPLGLTLAGRLYASILGGQPLPPDASGIGQPLFYVLAGFLILAVPTGLMGATLPVLMRSVVRTDADVGPRAALLYALNTAGAVAGAALAGFVLLGALGLRATVWVGVAVNAAVFAIAAALARATPTVTGGPGAGGGSGGRVERSEHRRASGTPERAEGTMSPGASVPQEPPPVSGPLETGASVPKEPPPSVGSPDETWPSRLGLLPEPTWILPVMALSGAATFTYEVLWTRLLAHVVGGSIHAFATMLAAFLTGIALGGGLAGPLSRSRPRAAGAFIGAQVAIAGISLAIFLFLDELLPAGRGLAVNIALATGVLVPPAVCIGATFPLAVRILTPDERLAARCTARVYAWNTVGAIAGALAAGFFLIPGLGFEGTLHVAVCTNLLLALAAAVLVARRTLALQAALGALFLAVVFFVQPPRPLAVMRASYVSSEEGASGRDLYFGVGRSSTVRLTELPTGYQLRNNGLPEAQIFARGAPATFHAWNWLAALPAIARPDSRSMLVVGLGGGVAIEHLPPSLEEVHVVELEEKVIEANRLIGPTRARDPLVDPRVQVIVNDARNALRLTGQRYDIIVSQPSQPWTAGASHLFTGEFARLAHERLAPGGVFVQWMNMSFLDPALLRSLVATLQGVYGHVRVYNPLSLELLFVASDAPLDLETALAGAQSHPTLAAYLARVGIAGPEDLLSALVLDDEAGQALAAGARPNTDDRNLMATQSHYREDGFAPRAFYEAIQPVDPLARRALHDTLRRATGGLHYPHLALRMIALHADAGRVQTLASGMPNGDERRLVEAIAQLAAGHARLAARGVEAVLAGSPADQEALWVLATMGGRIPAGTLSPAPAAVLTALRAERAGEWGAIAALDGPLAEARLVEPWYAEAVRLRAAWRLHVPQDERTARGREAFALLEELIPRRSDPAVLIVRAQAAEALGDATATLESAAFVAGHVSLVLQDARLAHRDLPRNERLALGAALEAVARAVEAHPEWRNEPRGPAVFEALEAVRTELLLPQ